VKWDFHRAFRSRFLAATLCLLLALTASAADRLKKDILYRDAADLDPYQIERCRLDLSYPKGAEGFATVVWFHAGGLSSGEKYFPPELQDSGLAVAAANYRLHPQVEHPAYIEDAAAAVAWVFKNIEQYGGDKSRIFVAGHSAGGYLTLMLGMDKRWLAAHGIDADQLAGLIPLSGHSITHFTIRKERGIPGHQAIIDEFAPQFHVRPEAPPILLITGDRDLELLGRYEENAYFWRMMQEVGHSSTDIHELEGFDHGTMVGPGCVLLREFILQRDKKS